jgi:hypothetical protein
MSNIEGWQDLDPVCRSDGNLAHRHEEDGNLSPHAVFSFSGPSSQPEAVSFPNLFEPPAGQRDGSAAPSTISSSDFIDNTNPGWSQEQGCANSFHSSSLPFPHDPAPDCHEDFFQPALVFQQAGITPHIPVDPRLSLDSSDNNPELSNLVLDFGFNTTLSDAQWDVATETFQGSSMSGHQLDNDHCIVAVQDLQQHAENSTHLALEYGIPQTLEHKPSQGVDNSPCQSPAESASDRRSHSPLSDGDGDYLCTEPYCQKRFTTKEQRS